ncbi:MAG: threonine/serine exporter ThrE family protein [Mangrovibacterium sp.]
MFEGNRNLYHLMQENDNEKLYVITQFLLSYASHLMGCGVHTSRVIRNTRRIGEAYGYDVELCVFTQHIIGTVKDVDLHLQTTETVEVQHLPINFEHNARLSSLSWTCYDEKIDFEELLHRYEHIISTPRLSRVNTLLMASAANAAFCQLFGGDALSILIVFLATAVAFYFRGFLAAHRLNNYLQVLLTAFVASIFTSVALCCNTTSEIALATSVLFLVPGVPLINGVIDAIEGHVLTGITRLINGLLIIVCLAFGLGLTLIITKGGLL